MVEELQQQQQSERRPEYLGGMRIPIHRGARLRITDDLPNMATFGGFTSVPTSDWELEWRTDNFDRQALTKLSGPSLIERLIDLSPEVSLAAWYFLRLQNPGFEYHAYTLSGEQVEDARGQALLDAFFAALSERHGAREVPINRLLMNVFARGAIFTELVLDRAGRVPIDLATPDSRHVRFDLVDDPDYGQTFVPYQMQGSEKVVLDRLTIRYVPLDPFPSKPKGRPIAAPVLNNALFRTDLFHDLRRVVAQQGYPRLDLSVDNAKLKERMPTDIAADPKQVREWYEGTFDDIRGAFSALEPDDAYVHPDWVTVNRPVGAIDSSSLGAVKDLLNAMDIRDVRGLKTMPLLMGMTESTTETQANRQWEIAAAGHKAVQHLVEQALEYLLTLALRVQGVPARVEFRFAEIRAAELMRDAQVALLVAQVAALKYDRGWISQNEAALEGADKETADQPEPRDQGQPADANAASENPEPGAGRHRGAEPLLWERIEGLAEELQEVRQLLADAKPSFEELREMKALLAAESAGRNGCPIG